jgi:hypothetical protein
MFEDAISHYRFSEEDFAHRLSRLMSNLVTQSHLRPDPKLIFPEFFSGGTVATRPRGRRE